MSEQVRYEDGEWSRDTDSWHETPGDATYPTTPAPDQTDRGALVEARLRRAIEAAWRDEWANKPNTVVLDMLAEALAPTVAALMTEHAARVVGERVTEVARRIEARRSEHWQQHLRDHPYADARSCPRDYGKHDAYLDAANIARAALAGDGEGA